MTLSRHLVSISEPYCVLSNVNLDGKDEYWNFEDQSHRPKFWIFYENPMTSVIDASSMGMSLGFSDRSRFVASYHVGGPLCRSTAL